MSKPSRYIPRPLQPVVPPVEATRMHEIAFSVAAAYALPRAPLSTLAQRFAAARRRSRMPSL